MFPCMNQCKEACCLTGTQPLLIELSVWSAWLSQWLITDNSISQRNTEVAPLVPSLGECSPRRLAVSLATTGAGRVPPPPRCSSAGGIAEIKWPFSTNKLIFFLSQHPMWISIFYSQLNSYCSSSCHQLLMQQQNIRWVIKRCWPLFSSKNVKPTVHVQMWKSRHSTELKSFKMNLTASCRNTAQERRTFTPPGAPHLPFALSQ